MGRALTTEQVNQRLAPRGIKLVGEWQRSKGNRTYECNAGHQWTTSTEVVSKQSGCPHCHYESLRLTKEEVSKRLAARDITLLGEWLGPRKVHQFQCSEEHVWEATASGVLYYGTGCPHCYAQSQRLTQEEVAQRLAVRGISLIGKWVGGGQLHRFRCDAGHEWTNQGQAPALFRKGCSTCSAENQYLTLKEVNRRLEPQGVRLDGPWNGTTEINRFVCNKGHGWDATGNGPVNLKTGCPVCNPGTTALNAEEVQARLHGRGLKLLGEWNGSNKENRFECSIGHEWETTGNGPIRNKGTGCPECSRLRRKKA